MFLFWLIWTILAGTNVGHLSGTECRSKWFTHLALDLVLAAPCTIAPGISLWLGLLGVVGDAPSVGLTLWVRRGLVLLGQYGHLGVSFGVTWGEFLSFLSFFTVWWLKWMNSWTFWITA